MKLRERILAHLRNPGYRPVSELEISRQLGLTKKDRRSLAHEIRLLLSSGDAALVKGDRIGLAADGPGDLINGKIIFRQGGSALVVPETARGGEEDDSAIQVAPE